MQRYGFRMFLNPGMAEEYKRRHDEIWPELVVLLKSSGISDYTIWLDEDTHVLYASLKRRPDHRMTEMAADPVMRRWWDYMKDLMRTHADGAPVAEPLREVFHLD
eukprot:gene45156-57472_t